MDHIIINGRCVLCKSEDTVGPCLPRTKWEALEGAIMLALINDDIAREINWYYLAEEVARSVARIISEVQMGKHYLCVKTISSSGVIDCEWNIIVEKDFTHNTLSAFSLATGGWNQLRATKYDKTWGLEAILSAALSGIMREYQLVSGPSSASLVRRILAHMKRWKELGHL